MKKTEKAAIAEAVRQTGSLFPFITMGGKALIKHMSKEYEEKMPIMGTFLGGAYGALMVLIDAGLLTDEGKRLAQDFCNELLDIKTNPQK